MQSLPYSRLFCSVAVLTLLSACASSEGGASSSQFAPRADTAAATSIPQPQSAREALELALAKLDAHGLSRGEIVLERIEAARQGARESLGERVELRFDAQIAAADAIAATKRLEQLLVDLRSEARVRAAGCEKTLEIDGGIRAVGVHLQLDLPSAAVALPAKSTEAAAVGSTIRAAASSAGLAPVEIVEVTTRVERRGSFDFPSRVQSHESRPASLKALRGFASELERSPAGLRVTRLEASRPKSGGDEWSWRVDVTARRSE